MEIKTKFAPGDWIFVVSLQGDGAAVPRDSTFAIHGPYEVKEVQIKRGDENYVRYLNWGSGCYPESRAFASPAEAAAGLMRLLAECRNPAYDMFIKAGVNFSNYAEA
jgi:hypothetical protein